MMKKFKGVLNIHLHILSIQINKYLRQMILWLFQTPLICFKILGTKLPTFLSMYAKLIRVLLPIEFFLLAATRGKIVCVV